MKLRYLVLSLGFCLSFHAALFAQEFYKGKTVRVIVGGTAGGGFDVYTRTLARHMPRHIPGNPTFVVENMTGAATRIAAKHVHSSAKPDGLTFGIFNGYLILGRVLGTQGIDFDVRKFEFIGVPVKDNVVCALHKSSGVINLQQWSAAKPPVKIGALGPGNSTGDVPRILKAASSCPFSWSRGTRARLMSDWPQIPERWAAVAGLGSR